MEDMLGLAGKAAIVWGGGQSMGEAYVSRLVRAGCDVAVVDMVAERADRVAEDVRRAGRKSVAIHADARDPVAVQQAVDQAQAALGPLELMATVIGLATWEPLLSMSLDTWRVDHAENLESFFLTAQAVAQRMAKGKGGAIVGTISVSGLSSAPSHAAYGAAKAGLFNLVRSMAIEWAPAIRVNAVAPGGVSTLRAMEMAARMGRNDTSLDRVAMRRMGTPDEMAKAGLFLLSDLASYVTGCTLPVDGGWSADFLLDVRQPPVR
jgi:NAD(P)-dependent dehydrogenase (short-subunit alcohol dehydrogenase family)